MSWPTTFERPNARGLECVALIILVTVLCGCLGAGPEGDPVENLPTSAPGSRLEAIRPSRLCVTSGRVDALDDRTLKVDTGGMRGFVPGGPGRVAEIAFRYPGPSTTVAPLANGEVRRQLGLKLRAKNTCNVVYVMWHVEPTSGIFVSVKHNPAASVHDECGAGGYMSVEPSGGVQPPPIRAGEHHTMRAELDGERLRVVADGALAWEGVLPSEASTFDGPAGVRSDNGHFDFELRVPGGARDAPACN
jgi:hypothetical protein